MALGGLRTITLYIPSECSSIPAPRVGVYSADDPVLIAGAAAYIIPFDRFSGSIAIRAQDQGRSGDSWQHTVACTIRRGRRSVAEWMARLHNTRMHIVTTDWHGERMFFEAMRPVTGYTLEPRLNSRNGYDFSFTRIWDKPGIALEPGIDYSSGGSGEGSSGGGSGGSPGSVLVEVQRVIGLGAPIGVPSSTGPRVAVNDAGTIYAWNTVTLQWDNVSAAPDEHTARIDSASGVSVSLGLLPPPYANSDKYIAVYRGGMRLSYGLDFTVVGTNIIFTLALENEQLLIITKTY